MNEELELKKLEAESFLFSLLVSMESLCANYSSEKQSSGYDSIGRSYAMNNILDNLFRQLAVYAEEGYVDVNEIFDVESNYWKQKKEIIGALSFEKLAKTNYTSSGIAFMCVMNSLKSKEPVWYKLVKYAIQYNHSDFLDVLKHIAPYINLYSNCSDEYKINALAILNRHGYNDILAQIIGNKNPRTLNYITETKKAIDELSDDENKNILNNRLDYIKFRTTPYTEEEFIEKNKQLIHSNSIYHRLYVIEKMKENDNGKLTKLISESLNNFYLSDTYGYFNLHDFLKIAIEKKLIDRSLLENLAYNFIYSGNQIGTDTLLRESVYDFKGLFYIYECDKDERRVVTVVTKMFHNSLNDTALKLYNSDDYFNKDNDVIIHKLLLDCNYEYLLQLLKSPNFINYDLKTLNFIRCAIGQEISSDNNENTDKGKDILIEIIRILNIKEQELKERESSNKGSCNIKK